MVREHRFDLRLAAVAALLAVLPTTLAACDDDGGGGTQAPACDLKAGELLITEVMAAPVKPAVEGAPQTEWFELYNASGRALSLTGVVLQAGPANNPRKDRIPALLDPGLAPGAYLAIGNEGTLGSGPWGYLWPEMVLNNTSATITVLCDDVVVDSITYGSAEVPGPPKPDTGASWQLSSRTIAAAPTPADPAMNDTPDLWCPPAADAVYDGELGDRGTPGAANQPCILSGECRDGDAYRLAVHPQRGDLVITEVYSKSPGDTDDTKDWLELHALADMDLNGLRVVNRNGLSPTLTPHEYPVLSDTCVHLAAGTWAILAGSADAAMNGGLPATAYAFEDGFDLLIGSNDDGAATITVVDARDTVLASAAHPACKEGVSQSLNPTFGSNADAANEPANWCPGSTTGAFEGSGSPAAPNPACPTGT